MQGNVIKNPSPDTYYTKTSIRKGYVDTYLYKKNNGFADHLILRAVFGSSENTYPDTKSFQYANEWCEEIKRNINSYTEHTVLAVEKYEEKLRYLDLIPSSEEMKEMGFSKFSIIKKGIDSPFLSVEIKGDENVINFLNKIK